MMRRPALRLTELQLLIAPALLAIVGLLTIFLVPRGTTDWSWGDLGVSIGFVAALLLMHLGFAVVGFRGDQVLLPITATLASLGLLMIQRLQPDLTALDSNYQGLAQKQLIYLSAGFAVLWGTAALFRGLQWLRRFKYTWLLVSLGLLAATMIFGTEINGARLWLSVGPFQAQPSELAKVTLVTFMAGYLEDYQDLVGTSWRLGPIRLPPIPYLLPMGAMWIASLVILIAQNDLGAALLFFGIFLSMLYIASGRLLYVSVGFISFAGASWVAYHLFSRIGIRVENWLNPWEHPLTSGWQQVQSDYALATGGLFGTGLGRGQPWRIPEVQTDFVFSAMGEELGLFGTLAVLALYLLLVMRGFAIGLRTSDGFARLVAVGLSAVLGIQTLIIIGGVSRLIPLTGITLPFVSYGGSSLLTNFLIVGILLNISSLPRRL